MVSIVPGKEHPGKNCSQEERQKKCFRFFAKEERACRDCLRYEEEYKLAKAKLDAKKRAMATETNWYIRDMERLVKRANKRR